MIKKCKNEIKHYQALSCHERALVITAMNVPEVEEWRHKDSDYKAIIVTIETTEGQIDVPITKALAHIPGYVDKIPSQLNGDELALLHTTMLHQEETGSKFLDSQGGAAVALGARFGIPNGILTVYLQDYNLYFKHINKLHPQQEH